MCFCLVLQTILGRRGQPRPQKHKFAFTGFIRCDECGCLYTAQTKKKVIKGTGEIKEYTYYHCTRKRRDYKCSQRKYLREEELELQVEKELEKYTILPEFRDWALEILNENNDKEINDRTKIHENVSKALLSTQKQLDNLTKMRYRDLIDDDEFSRERHELQNQITQLKEKLRETETRAEEWLELTEKTFNFATYAHHHFVNGDLETKKEILRALGSNPTIKDGKLFIQANEWLQPIKNGYPAIEKEYLGLEPAKMPLNKAKTEAFASVHAQWQGW